MSESDPPSRPPDPPPADGDDPPTGADDPRADPRVRRTRALLAGALVELALERPFAEITVRDLTDRAGVGYATFFRHYRNPEALLRAMLDDLLAELLALLEPLALRDPQRAGALVFAHARAHADLYRLLLASGRTLDLLPRAVAVGVASVRRTYRARSGARVPLELAAHHIVASFVELIRWWLERDMPYPPERMGEIYRDLILRPTEAAALEPRPPGELSDVELGPDPDPDSAG